MAATRKPKRRTAAKKKPKKPPAWLNRRDLAAKLGKHPQTITKWESAGLPIAKRGRRGVESLYDPVAVQAWLDQREVDAAARGGPLDPAQERARKDRAQAELSELRRLQLLRELLPVAEVEAAWGGHVAAARSRLLAVPQLLAPKVMRAAEEGERAVEDLLRHEINEVLSELAEGGTEKRGAA